MARQGFPAMPLDVAVSMESGPPTPTGLRIAIVGQGVHPIPYEGYGPVEKHIANLDAALRRRGEDVHLLNKVLPKFKFRLVAYALWVRFKLLSLRPDVVHCHSPINVRLLRILGIRPLVFTSHTRQWTYNGRNQVGAPKELNDHKLGFKAADERILISEQARRSALRSPDLAPLRCHVISNGVDVASYPVPRGHRGGHIIIGVGVIDPVKRWHLVATAIQGTHWTLELAGPITDPAYAQRLRSMPGVTLLGELDEAGLVAAFHRARLVAHPSEAEA